mmetsp:Transcript_8188/g.15453  ORF Transcript_8188/g.15453 Transcript_8188/m.15453 type:complete len:728 (+) Transcript_8188:155-2338(+)
MATLYPTEESVLHDEEGGAESFELDLDDLNLTSEDIDFDEIDDDLERFQEDEMVQQALQRGVDLRKYGQELAAQLKEAETETVAQYIENSADVGELKDQMEACDTVLARMQEMLLGFQADLGGISEEIKHLQDESLSMNIRLKNRRAAEDLISRFLTQCAMDPDMANVIQNGNVNEEFQIAVIALNKKLKYLAQTVTPKDGSAMDFVPKDTYVGQMLLPELEKLKMRAITKIKDYFLQQFGALRKTKTNVSMVQQNSLVKYADLLTFLQTEAGPVAEDIRTIYIESMSRTLFNLFKNYSSQLLKLDEVFADKHDLIGVEEAALRSMFTNKVNLSKRSDAFSLGERDKVLDQIETSPILVHVALAEAQKYPYEVLLRSVIKHLCDAATSEFLFALDFFKKNARDTFNRIFGRTLSLILENLENYLLTCHDSIGLLLMIKVAHAQRLVMQRRRVPVLDSFFDHMSMLFWPRFKVIFDANVKSLKSANPKKLGTIDLTPHYVSRRYAEFVSSILTLQGGSGDSFGIAGGGENMLMMNLKQLRVEIISLLERLGSQLGGGKEQKVFLINNIDQMLTVFQERRVMSEEVEKLEDMLMQQSELFAEEALKEAFPRLLSFVLQTERAMASADGAGKGKSGSFQLDEGVVGGLVKEFATSWRTGIQQLNDDILSYFTNFRNGMEILKQVLTQLLLYYTRFQDIIKKAWPRPPPFSKDVVTTSTILQEIKRYSRAF